MAPAGDVFLVQRRVALDDEELDRLAGVGVRHPHRGALQHARVQVDHLFDFGRVDVEARHQDHVLLAVDDAHVAALVHDADVAGLEPAVRAEHLGGFLRSLPVAGHHLWAADADFAAFTDGLVAPVVIADGDLGAGDRQADRAGEIVQVQPVGGGHRGGFGQAVTLTDRAAGDLEPLLGGGLLHRHAPAVGHHQLGEVQPGEVRIVGQRVVQRVDRREHVDAVPGQRGHQPGDVARIGNQQVAAPHAQAHEVAHRQREDVVKRQRADDVELAVADLLEHRVEPGLGLQDVGHHVAVQQRGALGQPGGAAGVLQEGDVVALHRHPRGRPAPTLFDHLIEAQHAAPVGERQAEFRHHLPDVPDHEVDQQAAPQRQGIPQRGQHHMAHGGVFDHLLQRVGDVLQDDDGLGAGVVELVLQLPCGVERVDVDHHHARTQHTGDGHHVLRAVGHHQRDAGAALQALLLQPGGKGSRLLVDVREAQRVVHVHLGTLRGVAAEGFVQQVHQAVCRVHPDLCRHPLGILRQPGLAGRHRAQGSRGGGGGQVENGGGRVHQGPGRAAWRRGRCGECTPGCTDRSACRDCWRGSCTSFLGLVPGQGPGLSLQRQRLLFCADPVAWGHHRLPRSRTPPIAGCPVGISVKEVG